MISVTDLCYVAGSGREEALIKLQADFASYTATHRHPLVPQKIVKTSKDWEKFAYLCLMGWAEELGLILVLLLVKIFILHFIFYSIFASVCSTLS